jgi:tRNA 2-thiouridine synthesizing protein E
MEKVIAGKSIQVNEEGYLTDFSQWDQSIGEEMAKEYNIQMSPRHWEVIKFLQEQHQQKIALSIRKIGQSKVVDIKEFYALFPQGPLKISTKIAGIPKPASCL